MKWILLFLICQVFVFNSIFAQGVKPEDENMLALSTILGYNFNGDGDWSNLTPEIFLGWTSNIAKYYNDNLTLNLRMGPTFSSIKNSKDTMDYYRSVMLPGNGSISIMPFADYKWSYFKFLITFAGSIKILSGINDSTSSIIQSNLRGGLGIQFQELAAITFQYTIGNHNSTSESESTYKRLFNQTDTDVKYYSINLQTYIPPLKLNLNLTYRQFDSDLQGINVDNKKIWNIGIQKDINMLSGMQAFE